MDPVVECRSEAAYAESPVAVTWDGERRKVERILARQRLPAGPSFRVLLEDGRILELHFHEAQDAWRIEEP